MAKATQYPERTIDFRVYDGNNNDLLGVANVELGELTPMTETVSGAGMAGEVESPIPGHYESMSLKLAWNSITEKGEKLRKPGSHSFVLRGALQSRDTTTGKNVVVPIRYAVTGLYKGGSLGTLEKNAAIDAEQEFEVIRMEKFINDKSIFKLDKFNYVAEFDGEDSLADVRKALGLS